MKDEIFSSLQKASLEIFPEFSGNFQVTKPQDSLHGDWSSNIALIMAKEMKKNPRELAIEIISALEGLDYSEKVEVAGAGFINIYLKEDLFFSQIKNYALGDFKGLLLEKEPKKFFWNMFLAIQLVPFMSDMEDLQPLVQLWQIY